MYSLLYFEDGYLQYITSPKYSKEYKNRYVGKLASENLARIWRASIERRATLPACGSCLTGASLRAPLRLRSALAACACLSAWTRSRRSRRSHCGWSERAACCGSTLPLQSLGREEPVLLCSTHRRSQLDPCHRAGACCRSCLRDSSDETVLPSRDGPSLNSRLS